MKWNKFRLKTTTESEDIVSSMLMDLCMRNITGDECPDVDALAADIMQTGHENIGKFVLEVPAQPQEDEDGI